MADNWINVKTWPYLIFDKLSDAGVARVTLNRIDIDGITVRDVQAIVVPDDQLAVNLLGMSFLSRVKWSHDRGKLVLEQ